MRNFLTVLILVFFQNYSNAQIRNLDAIFSFKMYIFLDQNIDRLNLLDSNSKIKDSLFNSYCNLITIKLDTLKIEGSYLLVSSALTPKFIFYKFKSHSWKRKLTLQESNLFEPTFGLRSDYVLAINQKTGSVYRISGFEGNDFLSFLFNFIGETPSNELGKITRDNFLKNYRVSELDFNCLYKGLHTFTNNQRKFPCLYRVKDPIEIH